MSQLGQEVNTVTSEDYGFKYLGQKQILPSYNEKLPFSTLHNLDISTSMGLYAASSGGKTVVGKLQDLRDHVTIQDNEEKSGSTTLAFLWESDIQNVILTRFVGHSLLVVTRDGLISSIDANKLDELVNLSTISNIIYNAVYSQPFLFVQDSQDKLLAINCSDKREKILAEGIAAFDVSSESITTILKNGKVNIYAPLNSDMQLESMIGFSAPLELNIEKDYVPIGIKTIERDKIVLFYGQPVEEDTEDVMYDQKVYFVDCTSGSAIYQESFDIIPAFGSVLRYPSFYDIKLKNLGTKVPTTDILMSAFSSEVTILVDDEVLQPSQDSERVVLPISKITDNDTNPIGCALDVISTGAIAEPCPGVDSAEALPLIYILNNEGSIQISGFYHATSIKEQDFNSSMLQTQLKTKEGKESLVGIDAKSDGQGKGIELPKQASSSINKSQKTESEKQPAIGNDSSVANNLPTFGQHTFGSTLATTTSSALQNKPAFGKPSFGNISLSTANSAFSTAPNSEKTDSAFSRPAFGTPAFGTSAFGTPSFTTTKEEVQDNNETESAGSTSSFFSATSKFGSSSFGQSAFGQPTFGHSVFGKPAFGQPAFSETKFSQSAFNNTTKESPFASLSSTKEPQETSTLQPNQKTAIDKSTQLLPSELTPAQQPYGTFGSAFSFNNTKESPFAKLSNKSNTTSAFGDFSQPEKVDNDEAPKLEQEEVTISKNEDREIPIATNDIEAKQEPKPKTDSAAQSFLKEAEEDKKKLPSSPEGKTVAASSSTPNTRPSISSLADRIKQTANLSENALNEPKFVPKESKNADLAAKSPFSSYTSELQKPLPTTFSLGSTLNDGEKSVKKAYEGTVEVALSNEKETKGSNDDESDRHSENESETSGTIVDSKVEKKAPIAATTAENYEDTAKELFDEELEVTSDSPEQQKEEDQEEEVNPLIDTKEKLGNSWDGSLQNARHNSDNEIDKSASPEGKAIFEDKANLHPEVVDAICQTDPSCYSDFSQLSFENDENYLAETTKPKPQPKMYLEANIEQIPYSSSNEVMRYFEKTYQTVNAEFSVLNDNIQNLNSFISDQAAVQLEKRTEASIHNVYTWRIPEAVRLQEIVNQKAASIRTKHDELEKANSTLEDIINNKLDPLSEKIKTLKLEFAQCQSFLNPSKAKFRDLSLGQHTLQQSLRKKMSNIAQKTKDLEEIINVLRLYTIRKGQLSGNPTVQNLVHGSLERKNLLKEIEGLREDIAKLQLKEDRSEAIDGVTGPMNSLESAPIVEASLIMETKKLIGDFFKKDA